MDALQRLREKGIVFRVERTAKKPGDTVLDSWALPARIVKEGERG